LCSNPFACGEKERKRCDDQESGAAFHNYTIVSSGMALHRNFQEQICADCPSFRKLLCDVGLFLIPAGVR
jgi:hypothetical protein